MSALSLERKLSLIDGRIAEVAFCGINDIGPWRIQTWNLIRRFFGDRHDLANRFQKIDYDSDFISSPSDQKEYFDSSVKAAVAILEICKYELSLDAEEAAAENAEAEALVTPDNAKSATMKKPGAGNIFIVHGHDAVARLEVSRVVGGLTGKTPIVLHEKANKGDTLIQKFEEQAESSDYAVVLLTADDLGRSKGNAEDAVRPRARQNVVFELGFFIGKLGRKSVAILYDDGVELPSDLSGLVYIRLDAAGGWHRQLGRELDSAGYDVDARALLGF